MGTSRRNTTSGARPPTRVLFPSMRGRKSSGSSPSPRKERHGVVSFTLNDHAKPMQGRALLDVSPEDIIKAILERREKIAHKLPSLIDERTAENNRAYRLAKESHDVLKMLLEGTETNQTQDDAITKAQNIYEENEAFRRRSVSRLQTAKTNSRTMKTLFCFGVNSSTKAGVTCLRTPPGLTVAAIQVMRSRKTRKTTEGPKHVILKAFVVCRPCGFER